jgi:hypothetical protein
LPREARCHDRAERATQAFAIVKDGKVIDSTDGGDNTVPASRKQIIALLKRTGLLQADAPR